MRPSCVFKVVHLLYHESVFPPECEVTVHGYHPSVQKVLNLEDDKGADVCLLDEEAEGLEGASKPSMKVVFDTT